MIVAAALSGASRADTINSVIGDASAPQPIADEVARIQSHLRHALAHLRTHEPGLAPELGRRRQAALRSLERYAERGVFPRRTSDAYPGRRPRFVDDRGTHCAVAQIMADSGATELVRAIAADHEYAYAADFAALPAVVAWAAEHGLALDELAIIQPRYARWQPDPRTVRLAIERATRAVARACQARHTAPPRIEVRVFVDDKSNARVASYNISNFAHCFTIEMTRAMRTRDAGYDEEYYFDLELEIPPPAV